MAVTLKIKRRAATGDAGSPASLKSGELAFNENGADKALYYGFGDDGAGTATSVVKIGGEGAFTTLTTNQTISGDKVFTGAVDLTGASVSLTSSGIQEDQSTLFFTTQRARESVSAVDAGGDGSFSYDEDSGVFTYTGPSASEVRAHLSVVDGGGDGSLSYDSGTGVITYTGPSASEVRAHLSADSASGLTYSSGSGEFALANVPNTSLVNSSVTVNGVALPLGGSRTVQGTASEVEVSTAADGTITVGLPDDVSITNDAQVGGDLTVAGDLTVEGNLTSISSSEVVVEDKNIVLGNTSNPTDVTADGGGLTLKGASDYSITWVASNSSWTFNQCVNIASGYGFKVGGTEVIDSNRVVSNLAITGSGNTIANIEIDGGTF